MNTPARRGSNFFTQLVSPRSNQEIFWEAFCKRISDGTVLPIVSDHVQGERVFSKLLQHTPQQAARGADVPTTTEADDASKYETSELLTEAWAEEIGYPMGDVYSLSRVALYNRLKCKENLRAKQGYLNFLKRMLLDSVEELRLAHSDVLADLRSQLNERSFADIVTDLDQVNDLLKADDPLSILAQLNLPVYVTTSYYDFLERAIRANGREPYTLVFGDSHEIRPEHQADRDFIPERNRPVVYHLHGLETIPTSIVLSEDDYLNFLVRITQPSDTQFPDIPYFLQSHLANSSLLLLGFQLQNWDFRATFKGLVIKEGVMRRNSSVAIQLSPHNQREIINAAEAENYLTEYFRLANFEVEWSDSATFMRDLWNRWNLWRKGKL